MTALEARLLTFSEFEARCADIVDLELSPFYWNALLHEVTGRGVFVLFVRPIIRELIQQLAGQRSASS